MENHQFGDTGGSWQPTLIADFTIVSQAHIPEPRRRAIADSFFTSLEAGAGDILNVFYLLSEKKKNLYAKRRKKERRGRRKRVRRKIGREEEKEKKGRSRDINKHNPTNSSETIPRKKKR